MKKFRLLFSLIIGQIIFTCGSSQEPGPFSGSYPPVVCIISNQSKMLIDLPAGSKEDNKAIIPYEYNRGINQFWCIYKDKKGYVILSPVSKKVLAVNKQDSTLIQQDFNRNKLQYWDLISDFGGIQIFNKSTNLFITFSSENNPLQLRPNTKGVNQQWTIIEPWNRQIGIILKANANNSLTDR